MILVVAGVLIESDRIMLAQRPMTTHHGGHWEFPGGKVEAGEGPHRAIARELKEEVGIDVDVFEPVWVTHLEERDVTLLFLRVARRPRSPMPSPIEANEIRWIGSTDLAPEPMLPADLQVLKRLRSELG